MKRKGNILLCICACFLMTACTKEPANSELVNDIIAEQDYVEVSMGEAYHQEKVLFDVDEEKAVIPENAQWGRLEFRDEEEAGSFYGPEEGGEVYETDMETTPELYLDSYMASIANLGLTVEDVKNEDYVIKVAKKSQLQPFAEELIKMSNIVVKDNYRLTGVEIEFDKQCRPVRKCFQLQEIDKNELKTENESQECVQEFSYEIGKRKFENAFEKVRKGIEEE